MHEDRNDERWAGHVRQAYDTIADDYARALPDTRAESPLELAMVEVFADRVRDAGTVLDGGCGTGRMARHLTGLGCQVVGVDLSPGMVEQARRLSPGVDLTVASLLDLPFGDATFAGVLLWYSTIHVPDDQLPGLLAEAVRVVRPGGSLLLGLQAGEGSVDLSAKYAEQGHDVTLTRWRRTADEIAAALGAVGAEEVARLVRAPAFEWEGEDQAFVLARRSD
ncbi:class I SAM-dependent methyltransferase [Ornithinimicrobium humiphilum]|uniref:Methyltransferase family protein n=1 Tax=Ornithinimicrobium humiphilum TaxID=125288 RepID=A0A543K898_9MICO|nr:class I SAM-dependent methyltransferase [Ornithinimicrobium humiphilum]TQM91301.1 methyltransferase family protein [Ornithinimicrobium humiphilum]